ncbi:MAG: isoprenylcysteine carboxylmethyltransferase family protein [Alphaproteobacteria bacterium]|nr:isoprenylcysteine carboxylmethyltransferase family protein [Alphaproteobacteria bacterium]
MSDFTNEEETLQAEHSDFPDNAGVLVAPPRIYAGFLALAFVLEMIWGMNVFIWGVQMALGILTISFGAGLLTWCVELFHKSGTPLSPKRATRELIVKGPFSLSRNPIYIALTAIYLGICILFDLFWGLLLVVPLVLIIRTFVIEKEEVYLEKVFGQNYLDYKNKVRRWF